MEDSGGVPSAIPFSCGYLKLYDTNRRGSVHKAAEIKPNGSVSQNSSSLAETLRLHIV